MERKYEVMFIVRPDMAEEDVTKLVSTFEQNAIAAGAKVLEAKTIGRQRLAYHVQGFADGIYVLFTLNAEGKAIHEVERRLRVNEPVIKFLTVRVDDSEKRAAKMAKLRAAKVKRSSNEPVVAEAAPAAPAAPAPDAAAPASA